MAERTADGISTSAYLRGVHSACSVPAAFASRVSPLKGCYRFMAEPLSSQCTVGTHYSARLRVVAMGNLAVPTRSAAAERV